MTRIVHQIEALINQVIEDIDPRCVAGSEEPHHVYSSPQPLTKFLEDRCDRLAFLLCAGERCILCRIGDDKHTQWPISQNWRIRQLRKGGPQLACQPIGCAEKPFGVKVYRSAGCFSRYHFPMNA